MWYAERGHLVFPLRPNTKIPATKHGFKDASMNPDTIRAWWTTNAAYNIGLTTGRLFDVIDIDGEAGIRSLIDLEDNGHLPQVIARVCTPRGMHLLIAPTGDGCATGLLPGIDYRGLGGYVVAPPSRMNGLQWTWTQPPDLSA